MNWIVVLVLFVSLFLFSKAYADGLASETLPPAMIQNANVNGSYR